LIYTLYHEISKDNLNAALSNGLKRSPRGAKGSDQTIIRTDHLLDSLRPQRLIAAGVSRDNNLYCYLAVKHQVVDITTGQLKEPKEISADPQQLLLKLQADGQKCFVSNLDIYDQVKAAVKSQQRAEAHKLAQLYWEKLSPLSSYRHENGFRRPEVMVTYDIPPQDLSI
jgi:hypothetical protein